MTLAPGSYLRDMREADGRTIRDVALCLRMLKFVGPGRVWPIPVVDLAPRLERVERGEVAANKEQLLSLSLVITEFRPARFRQLANLQLLEVANG